MLTNAGGHVGDALVLTKPLGVGAITTAHKRGAADQDQLDLAVEAMVALNDAASRQALRAGAHAATDVTGFGLLGHLHNLVRESGVAAQVVAADLPALPGAVEHLAGGAGLSGGARRNRTYAEQFTDFGEHVPEADRMLACDPVTSGGLLVAVEEDAASELDGWVIGRLVTGEPGSVSLI
jgi:selenide,water dikinase